MSGKYRRSALSVLALLLAAWVVPALAEEAELSAPLPPAPAVAAPSSLGPGMTGTTAAPSAAMSEGTPTAVPSAPPSPSSAPASQGTPSSAAQPALPLPVPVPDQPLPPENDLSLPIAVLGGLDKVTARVVTIDAPVGQPVHFGTLEIVVRACRKHPPEEDPESAAFLDVWDLRPNQPAKSVFRGWMFASSPALSAMEHPIYDLWVLDCRADAGRKAPGGADAR